MSPMQRIAIARAASLCLNEIEYPDARSVALAHAAKQACKALDSYLTDLAYEAALAPPPGEAGA